MNFNSQPIVEIKSLSKKYRLFDSQLMRLVELLDPLGRVRHKDFWALDNVSLDIYRGECVGILGRNGSGKSTLLQIVAGVLRPTFGDIDVSGRIAALLELGSGFDPALTGRENVRFQGRMNGVDADEMERRILEIKAFADIGNFFDQPLRIYSSGMYARIAFASAINVNPDILLVDEVLSVGDAKFQEKCFRKLSDLRAAGVTTLLVSHDVQTVLQICDRCVFIDKGKILFVGAPKEAVNAYHELLYGNGTGEFLVAPRASSQRHDQAAYVMRDATIGISEVLPAARPLLDWLLIDTTLEERFDIRLSYNKDYYRIGNKQAQILDFIVVADDDVDAIYIGRESLIEIYLRVRYHCHVPSPIIGMALTTREGSNVFGTNTQLMSVSLSPGREGSLAIYRFRFRNCLGGGHYFLNIGVAALTTNGEMSFLDNLRSIAHLVFEDTPASTGYVNPSCGFKEDGVVQIPGGECSVQS